MTVTVRESTERAETSGKPRPHRRTVALSPVVGAVFLMACVDGGAWREGGYGEDPCEFDGPQHTQLEGVDFPLSPQEEVAAGETLVAATRRYATAFDPPVLGWDSASCLSLAGADADTDGYPDASGTLVLDSCMRAGSRVSGSIAFTDADGGATSSFAHSESADLQVETAGVTHRHSYTAAAWVNETAYHPYFLDLEGTWEPVATAGPGELHLTYESVTIRYRPTDGAWVPGAQSTSGTVHLSGGFIDLGFGSHALRTEVMGMPSGMEVRTTCPTRIVSGGVLAFYPATGYSACGDAIPVTMLTRAYWTTCGSFAYDTSCWSCLTGG